MTRTVKACPECDGTDYNVRSAGGFTQPEEPGRFKCKRCKAVFDEPVVRDARAEHDFGHRGPWYEALVAADPDEVP